MSRREPRSILITGASSGLGDALACAYARPGVHLALGGRDPARLREVTDHCLMTGAQVTDAAIDVTDSPAMAAWIQRADDRQPLDLVIANAGISARTAGTGDPERRIQAIFSVNLAGVVNSLLPAIRLMQARGQGQLAIMSSLAGFIALPDAASYCASKAAVRVWGEGLRGALAAEGIAVTVICPGYIKTPMTAGAGLWMPLAMEADAAAALIKRRLARAPARIAFPWPLYAAVRLFGLLPAALATRLLAAQARET